MSLILIVLCFYGIGKLIVRHRARVQEARRQEECRMQLLEREQARLAKEQERQSKAQDRMLKEQAKQAEQLRKHERRLADMEQKLAQAEADIEHWTEQVCKLYALLDVAQAEQFSAVPGSKADLKAQKQIIALDNQIHSAEARLNKAKYTKRIAEKELSA